MVVDVLMGQSGADVDTLKLTIADETDKVTVVVSLEVIGAFTDENDDTKWPAGFDGKLESMCDDSGEGFKDGLDESVLLLLLFLFVVDEESVSLSCDVGGE